MSLEPIAIVGTGCRFPGSSSSPARLWDLIQNPRDVASKVPSGRFNVGAFYHPNSQQHGATSVAESYFLEEDIRAFDASFFNISPAEAAALDPQQRLLLETVSDSLDAGGHRLDVLQGSPTGVYCGFLRTDYSQIQFADPDSIPPYTVTGNSPAIMANRISYFFNWTGPSFSVDTGCSSSLLAVHLAVEALRKGDCAMAVAVGSNLILSPNAYIADAKTGMLSATGRSRMWDASADGYARGEGVASVVLKRLSDATAAGDEIECVIRATGVNSDGRTMGITMPNGQAQQQLIESTYASIGLDPKNAEQRCQYFEAHGTGTQAGDPQEASAIYGAFFGDAAPEDSQVLHVGSIKTVIGHTEATAGLAGLIKASLCLQHGEIVPNLLLSSPNPRIVPYLSRLRVPDERVPWPSLSPGVPRRASVNSFGFGGANVHAILESYAPPSSPRRRKEDEVGSCLLPFAVSAASELSLGMVLKDLLQFLDDNPMINLMDLALTLMTRRSCHKYRVMFTATSADELRDQITKEISRRSSGRMPVGLRRHVQSHLNSRILGIFTGQGAQWPQMGLDLIRTSPQAQKWMADMQGALDSLPLQYRPDFDLMTELAAPDSDSRVHEAGVSQPLRTAIQIVQTNLLRNLGLKFDSVIGHSSGEIAAAYAAGMLDLADTIRVAYLRGWAIQQSQHQQNPGSMVAVMLNWKQAGEICNRPQYVGKIQIAAYNSPTSVTLSGDREAIDELVWLLSSLGQAVHPLHVDTAYHSHHMHLSAEVYRRALEACKIQPRKPSCPVRWFSTAYPGVDLSVTRDDQASDYWVANMLKSVSFSQAVAVALQSPGTKYDCVIEVGPHPVMRGPVSQILEDMSRPTDLPYLCLAKRAKSGLQSFAAAIGELWTVFGPGDLDVQAYVNAFNTNASGAVVKGLPRYPFDHSQSYWAESRLSRARLHARNPPNALLGGVLPTSGQGERRWRNYLRPEELPWLHEYRLNGKSVLPPATYVAMMVEAAIAVAGASPVQVIELHELEIYQEVPVPLYQAGLETLFAVGVESDGPCATGKFACQAAVHGELCRVASGRFKTTYGAPDARALPARFPSAGLNPMDVGDFYSHLSALGHDYAGDFKRLSTLSCNRKAASTTMTHPGSENQPALHIHPATIDHAFQTLLAASISRRVDKLTKSLYRISKISYLAINPTMRPADSETLTIDAALLTKAPGQITGAIDIFRSNDECVVSCEGLHLNRTANHPTLSSLFSRMDWIPLQPSAAAGGKVLCRPGVVSTLMGREQLALLHLRELWGMNPVWRPGWLEKNLENICTPALGPLATICEEWKSLFDFECKTRAPTVELLDEYYAANLQDFAPWYDRLVSLVGQLAALYPEMNILEVTSSGTDRVTRRVLREIGTAYNTYTRAVIHRSMMAPSTKPPAQPFIQEQDLEDLSFEPDSVDLIIVHQALYNTKSLTDTLTMFRRLLKIGGYLLVLEDTNPHLIHRNLLLPLSAWQGNDAEHPSHGPVRTREAWKDLLIDHGFSGIDSITPIHDEVISGLSIIVCQTGNPTVHPTRNLSIPSNEHPDLVIAAARSTWMDRTWLAVHENFRRMVLVEDISKIEFTKGRPAPVVLVVTDSLNPRDCLSPGEETRLLRRLFAGASKLLWVTSRSGARMPVSLSMAVTAGLLCGFSMEHPDTIFQYLELPSSSASKENVRTVATLLMHLVRTDARDSSRMTTGPPLESQLRLSEKGVLYVPRHTYSDRMNQRRLAAHLQVEDVVLLNQDRQYSVLQLEHVGTVEKRSARLHAYRSTRPLPGVSMTTVEVKVHFSTAHSIKIEGVGVFYLLIGVASRPNNAEYPLAGKGGSRRVLALSERNATRVRTPSSWCWAVPPAVSAAEEPGFLANTVGMLVAKGILSQTEPGSVILVLEPDITSLHVLNSLAPLHKIEILAITHKATVKAKKQGVIYIPERTPTHRLRQMLPVSKVGALVFHHANNDDNVQKRIRSLFPSTRHFDICSFYQVVTATAHSPTHVPAFSIRTALESASGWLYPKDATFTVCSVAKSLFGEVDLGPTTVIDWLSDEGTPIRAQIHPASDGVSLSPQSTYVLWGLPEALGRVVAEWLVTHGAQHLVLVAPFSKNPQWVSAIASGGAKVITVPPKEDLVHTVLAIRGHPSLPSVQGIVFSGELDTGVTPDIALANTIERAKALSQLYDSPNLDLFLGVGRCPVKQDPQQYAVTEYLSALAHQRAMSGLPASVLCLGPGLNIDALDGDDISEILAEAVLAGDPVGSRFRMVTAGLCPDTGSPEYKVWEASHWFNPAMSNMLALSRKARQENLVVKTDAENTPLSVQLERVKQTASAVTAVRGILSQHFTRYLQALLQSATEITDNTLFNELGVDSIVASQLGGWFSREVGVKVSVVFILAGSSVGDVLQEVAEKFIY
ncbi:non-reducing polyketide synthase pyr2 [Aspergillus novofumigatus IBT 16806]|uniref:Ketoacyl-synt-domain-containing protein n=1 Tax=Aspergillus novofumigatus (strain IBT 16806) TaxID=1392255 RepID=A0A2I1CCR3_ASPN1|nr:ketoacyl-synt-domain-containing protein [Aspergillus novofumigatus IBT 16806]PKX95405.1 ketoacyl-synt-domain-containing protein [Aspergillus novofumigatus IBT 16806]